MQTATDHLRARNRERNEESIALSVQRIAVALERIADSMENDPLRALDAIMVEESRTGDSGATSDDLADTVIPDQDEPESGKPEPRPLEHVSDPVARKWLGLED